MSENNDNKLPPSRDLMPGLHFINEDDKRWRVQADNIDVLVNALGSNVLEGFCQCFAVADRVITTLHLMAINDAHAPGHRDQVDGERNFIALCNFACGFVYELVEGLETLDAAGVAERLSPEGRKRWASLMRYATLEHRQIIKLVRNLLAFHPGEKKVVRRGIKTLSSEGAPVTVMASEGTALAGVRHEFAMAVVIAGIRVSDESIPVEERPEGRRLQEEDLAAAFKEARDCKFKLMPLLQQVFADALRVAGADLGQLGPEVESEIEGDSTGKPPSGTTDTSS